MATNELNIYIRAITTTRRTQLWAEGEAARERARIERTATSAHDPVHVPVSIQKSVGDLLGTDGGDCDLTRGGGVSPGSRHGERPGLHRGPFNATATETTGANTPPIVTLDCPLDVLAAMALTFEREAYGHDPRPKMAELGVLSLIHELDKIEPDWRSIWPR